MSQISDIDKDSGSRNKQHVKRLKKGECPQCGIKLFKIGGVLGKKKTPLTIKGHVENGRCLACDPYTATTQAILLSSHPQRSYTISEEGQLLDANGAVVPQFLTLRPRGGGEISDSATVISGITMDQHLQMTFDIDEVEDDVTVDLDPEEIALMTSTHVRENDSSCISKAETTPLRSEGFLLESTSLRPNERIGGRTIDRDGEISSFTGFPLRDGPKFPRPESSIRSSAKTSEESKREIGDSIADDPSYRFEPPLAFDWIGAQVEENTAIALQPHSSPSESSRREIFFDSTLISIDEDKTPATDPSQDIEKILSSMVAAESETTSDDHSRPPIQPRLDPAREEPAHDDGAPEDSTPGVLGVSLREEFIGSPVTLPFDNTLADTKPFISPRRRRPNEGIRKLAILDEEAPNVIKSTTAQKFNADQFRDLVNFLKEASEGGTELCLMDGTNSTIDDVTSQLWKGGKQAKLLFHECRGYESLTQIMWSHMVHEPLEERAVELFLACVASDENDGKNDTFETSAILATEEARNAIEALLFVMQSLSHNRNIQVTACRSLVCLATASGLSQGQVDDGSNSGAAAVVLHAMSAHRDITVVQKWSLRALYELCTISANAESNKRTLLAASTLQGGSGDGLGAVLECLVRSPPMVEAVRLVWCLSASENARGTLDPKGDVLDMLIQILRENSTPNSSDAVLMEPLLGAISNLIVTSDDGKSLSEGTYCDLVCLAMEVAKPHRDNIGLCTEAIGLLGNILALGPVDKNTFIEIGGIRFIADLVIDKDDAENLHEECACALLSLTIGCEKAKAAMRGPQTFAAVKRMSRLYESSVKWQEILCTLISSVVATTDANALACEKDAIGAVCFAMTLHTDAEKVQEAACVTLRNVSSRKSVNKHLVESDAVELVIDAIARHNSSKAIVLNGCETLWNAGFSGSGYPEISKALISSVLEAMRSHIDDVEFMHSTIGVLLRALVGSESNKREFCEVKGLEVVTSVILIHRETDELLIKACGLLASLSCLAELVPSVVEAGGIVCTIDSIRDTSKSTAFLTSAAQVLTNAVLAMPDQCDEVGGIVSVLIERMREFPHETQFQSEACRLIWALASLSDPVRSRILALDGAAVLMATLENNKEPTVQNNALEAFNELAMSTNELAT